MEQSPRDTVVLIHGLGRSPLSLLAIRLSLSGAGFDCVCIFYPSRRVGIQQAVDDWLKPRLAELRLEHGVRVHFVTHSLGGILFRAWAAQREVTFPLGRTVMLGAPNQGSEILDLLQVQGWVRWLLGPVVHELGTGAASTPLQLGAVPEETGIVMGNRILIPLFRHCLGPASDGIVSVIGGHVTGEADFIVLPVDHTTMLLSRRVMGQITHFLREGRFQHG